jgi:hypothetical protein
MGQIKGVRVRALVLEEAGSLLLPNGTAGGSWGTHGKNVS